MAQACKPHPAPSSPWWPRGLPAQLRVPRMTLPEYLAIAARRYPDKPAIIYGGESLTYAHLHRRVQALSTYLQRNLGVAAGDRVLLISQNCPQWVTAFYAVLAAQAVVVPINPMSTTPEVRWLLQDSGARIALASHDALPALMPLLQQDSPGDALPPMAQPQSQADGLNAIVVHAYVDAIDASLPADAPELAAFPAPMLEPLDMQRISTSRRLHGFEQVIAQGIAQSEQHASLTGLAMPADAPFAWQTLAIGDPDALAVLPYTSGTTGHPKGCMHTHATVLASNISSQLWRGLHAESVFLCVAPLFHMLGLQNGMNVPITLGATTVMLPRWHAPSAIDAIARHRVSVWAAPPAMVIDCFSQTQAATADLASLAVLSGGGAAMPEAIATMLQQRFGLAYNEAYGLTETASFLHANPLHRGKKQCLGVPTLGVRSIIVDPATLKPLPAGDVGELLTFGPQLMKGYWRNDKANQQAFVDVAGQRWFRTGDLACVDDEGYFFMRDRLKRMINASGYKVWPAEVENALYDHPAIQEACVIASPDTHRGETVKALVVLKPDFVGRVSADDLIAWGRERMAVYKAPRMVVFMECLPRSATGKIAWRALQEHEWQAATAAPNVVPTDAAHAKPPMQQALSG